MSLKAIKNKAAETCEGCGLTHPWVEASGIYYCPNPLCMMCGASNHRRLLPSFRELSNGKHSVETRELVLLGRWLLGSDIPWDPRLPKLQHKDLLDALKRSLNTLLKEEA